MHMAIARGLRFRTSLMKRWVSTAWSGVARDKATAYSYTLKGRKTAPLTDFDPFSAPAMHYPRTRDTVCCSTWG